MSVVSCQPVRPRQKAGLVLHHTDTEAIELPYYFGSQALEKVNV